MSKYTTEVRYICESEAGLDESAGANRVDDIIANSRAKIFDFSYPIYDESYRNVLETKILKHYYTREIGLETVGLWKLKLNTKMNEIMPYYNQLYKSALLEFNPLWTDEYQTLHNRKIDGINERNEFSTSSGNSSEITDGTISNYETSVNTTKDKETIDQSKNNNNVSTEENKLKESGTSVNDTRGTEVNAGTSASTNGNVSRDKYADTPQGALTDLEADKYLTNARKITNDGSSTTNENNTNVKTGNENGTTSHDSTDNRNRIDLNEEKISGNNEKTSDSSNVNSSNNNIDTTKTNTDSTDNSSVGVNTFNNIEDYLEYVKGRRGKDASELLLKYRKTFLNIDMQVIDDLEELFLHLW